MMNGSSSQCSELVVVGGVFDKQNEFCQSLSDLGGAVFLNFLASKLTDQLNFYCS